MAYSCISCRKLLEIPAAGAGSLTCPNCNFLYEYEENYLHYEPDALLIKNFKKKYLLYKSLANNAYISYLNLKEFSLSFPGREDVNNFKGFILSNVTSGKILDIGCGILEVPGYLDFEDKSPFEFFGLDPIDDKSFKGVRIVGCAEYLPFPDNYFQAVVFATSMDHVCSLEQTIAETYRVLAEDGKVLIWMSDRVLSFREKLLYFLGRLKRFVLNYCKFPGREGGSDVFSLYKKEGPVVTVGKYVVYENFTVFHIPAGAVDPFHSYNETPRQTIALMKRADFRHDDTVYNNKNEVFLCFTKRGRK